MEHGRVGALGPAQDPRVLFSRVFERQRAEGRRERQGQEQGHQEGDHDRVGEGLEHLALHAFERQDREEDQDDDQNAEEDRLGHFPGRAQDHRGAGRRRGGVFGQMAVDVFHDHDGAVHHHADRDDQAAQGHEVGRQADLAHDDEGRERRDDERGRDDECAADVPEEQEEDDDHQDDPLQQRLVDGVQGRHDQLDAVVERHDPESPRQNLFLVDLLDLVLHVLDDFAGVAAAEHQDDAGHDFAFAVDHRGAVPHRMADLHFGHVAHVDRRAVRFLDDDVLDVLQRFDEADAADDVLLGALFQNVAAGVGVVLGDGFEHVVQGQVVLAQEARVHHDLILLDEAADRVHVDDVGEALEQRADDPVFERAPFHQFGVRHDEVRILVVRPFQIELVDFAERGRIRHELRDGARRQALLHFEDPLQHDLAGQVNIHVVSKDQRDHRQADLRQRTDVGQAGRAGQLQLQREGDEALDFSRRQPLRLGDDLHEHRRHVGKGVDRDRAKRIQAAGRQDERQGDDQHALPESQFNEGRHGG